MTLICSWCQKLLFKGSEVVSHGCCEACMEKYFGIVTDTKER